MQRELKETEEERDFTDLEDLVTERTVALARTVEALRREVAERMETERALRDSQRNLRNLSQKIVEIQENERKQIAKEIHDSIGASLAAIKFAVEERLANMDGSPPADLLPLEEIVGHLRGTIQEVRRISTHLRPSMLDDLGLLATMQWYCRSQGRIYADTQIETRLDIPEDRIDSSQKTVIYRVMQEALNNALKHGGADRVRMGLEAVRGGLRLSVTDNGGGFDPERELASNDPMTGHGLKGMRDRAEVLGGTLQIASGPGRGTVVQLDLPVRSLGDAPEAP